MTFTPDQIKTGKTLVKWLIKQGFTRDKARQHTAIMLKANKLKDVKHCMKQSNCTSFTNLKTMLTHKK